MSRSSFWRLLASSIICRDVSIQASSGIFRCAPSQSLTRDEDPGIRSL